MAHEQSGPELLQHVRGHGVRPEAHENALGKHRRHVGHAHRIIHVGLRVVDDRRAGLGEPFHLVAVDVHTVRGDRPGTEDPEPMKPLDHTHPVLAHAVFLIRRRLCDVHVEAGPEVSARGGGSLERQRRVQAEHRAQPLVAPAPAAPDERRVLGDPGASDLDAVAVGHLVAEARAHADSRDCIRDDVERASHGGRARLVVHERRRAVVHVRNDGDISNVLHFSNF